MAAASQHDSTEACLMTAASGCLLHAYHQMMSAAQQSRRVCCVYRAPWRLAAYWHQTKDDRILPLLKAQQQFFEGQKMIAAGYKLDGTPLENYSNIAFLAPVWCLFKVSVH